MRKGVRILSLILAGTMVAGSLTGCGSVSSNDVASYPLVKGLTNQEVIDFYAEALKYDTVIARNLDVHETNYELKEVSEDKAQEMIALTNKAQEILGKMEYEYTRSDSMIVPEETFHYIKSYLNSLGLKSTGNVTVREALGYYFVDVEYDVVTSTIGTIKDDAHLLGINGAFAKDYVTELDEIDTVFLEESVKDLNEYYEKNKIPKMASMEGNLVIITETEELNGSSPDSNTGGYNNNESYYDPFAEFANNGYTYDGIGENNESTEVGDLLSTDIPQSGNLDNITSETENNEEETTTESGELDTETTTENTELTTENTELTTDTNSEVTTEPEVKVETTTKKEETNIITSNNRGDVYIYSADPNRVCKIDVNEFSSIIGSSSTDKAYMPELNMVYEIPEASSDISGIGIYPSGGNALGIFGMNRENISGKITLRYVFKENLLEGTYNGVNIYPVRETINTGMTTASDNVQIAEFLKVEFEKLLERADRASIDNLLKPLISGHIYEDMGIAMLRGYEANYTDVIKQMSTIRQVLGKNTDINSWLLEIETTRIEGSKAAESYATYRDKYFIVIQQKGKEFVITDTLRTSRTLVDEPSIEPDSATEKRLVALGLAGEVQETEKEALRKLMDDWYLAGTYRKVTAGEATRKGQTVTIERGMQDLLNSDVTMLSTDDMKYTLSEAQNELVKHGTSVNSEYIGTISEWLGGNHLQVEFTTEELITYDGKGDAVYMQVYYLVSNMDDIWVIDERTVIEKVIVNGSEVETLRSRLSR